MMKGIQLTSSPTTMFTAALLSTLFVLVAVGCDHLGHSRTPQDNAGIAQDGGEDSTSSSDGGPSSPDRTKPNNPRPGPSFTAQPGDIQL